MSGWWTAAVAASAACCLPVTCREASAADGKPTPRDASPVNPAVCSPEADPRHDEGPLHADEPRRRAGRGRRCHRSRPRQQRPGVDPQPHAGDRHRSRGEHGDRLRPARALRAALPDRRRAVPGQPVRHDPAARLRGDEVREGSGATPSSGRSHQSSRAGRRSPRRRSGGSCRWPRTARRASGSRPACRSTSWPWTPRAGPCLQTPTTPTTKPSSRRSKPRKSCSPTRRKRTSRSPVVDGRFRIPILRRQRE